MLMGSIEMRLHIGTICRILKNAKKSHGGMWLLVKLQASAYNFNKSNTPPCFFPIFKIQRMIQNSATHHYADGSVYL